MEPNQSYHLPTTYVLKLENPTFHVLFLKTKLYQRKNTPDRHPLLTLSAVRYNRLLFFKLVTSFVVPALYPIYNHLYSQVSTS